MSVLLDVVPAALAATALLLVLLTHAARERLVAVLVAIAVISIGVTVTGLLDTTADDGFAVVGVVEMAALVWLVVLLARTAPPRLAWPAGVLAGVAQGALVLRDLPGVGWLDAIGSTAFVGLASVAGGVGGVYLRSLDARRVRAVADARRTQRLALARDLHDFVAHDVSGIVVQAQAAQVVAEQDPAQVLSALRRIEDAGLQALAAMDRTVHMLREADGPDDRAEDRQPQQGIGDLPALVERFSETGGGVRVRLDVDVPDEVPREVGSTVYRFVVESLTNVRRHAPDATEVVVTVHPAAADGKPGLTVAVHDNGTGEAASLARRGGDGGGLGLHGLTERVEALDGHLRAGPPAGGGWTTEAFLPVPPKALRR